MFGTSMRADDVTLSSGIEYENHWGVLFFFLFDPSDSKLKFLKKGKGQWASCAQVCVCILIFFIFHAQLSRYYSASVTCWIQMWLFTALWRPSLWDEGSRRWTLELYKLPSLCIINTFIVKTHYLITLTNYWLTAGHVTIPVGERMRLDVVLQRRTSALPSTYTLLV